MNYAEIDSYMQRTGLAKEPAFDFLHFLIEGIPPQGKNNILGLYFPEGEIKGHPFGYLPPSTIILPADASESTLLHELGHRYGHFYYNNISESFAENWRKSHEKESAVMLREEESVKWQKIASMEGLSQRRGPVNLIVGDFEITNLVVFAQYGGAHVTTVPPGAGFEIHAEYNIANHNAGITFWTQTMTVYNKTDNIAVGYDSNGAMLGSAPWLLQAQAINLVMPSHPIVYRVTIWANQAAHAGAPPTSQW